MIHTTFDFDLDLLRTSVSPECLIDVPDFGLLDLAPLIFSFATGELTQVLHDDLVNNLSYFVEHLGSIDLLDE